MTREAVGPSSPGGPAPASFVCPRCGHAGKVPAVAPGTPWACPACGVFPSKYRAAQVKAAAGSVPRPPRSPLPDGASVATRPGQEPLGDKWTKRRKRLLSFGLGVLLVALGGSIVGSALRERREIQKRTGALFFDRTEYDTTTRQEGILEHTTLHKREVQAEHDPTAFRQHLGALMIVGGFVVILVSSGLTLTRKR